MILDIASCREFFYVTIGVVLLITAAILYCNVIMKRDKNRLTSYALHINTVIDTTIPETLETMCQECFNDYMVLNPSMVEVDYITDEMETTIQHEVLEALMQRISPAFIDKLSLYYNPNQITDVIARKLIILVTGYVIETNSIKNAAITKNKE